jgi:cell fate (sporulation/competence/biofilm development) regulator YlbF (YheA/YmcA/DUF963 family)
VDAITELAERLGKQIAESPQARSLRDAREAFNRDKELTQLLKDFQAQSEKVAKLEADNKPIEVEDKHRLGALRERLLADDRFKALTAAQMEYVDLMRKVNAAMGKHLQGTEQAAGDAPAESPT